MIKLLTHISLLFASSLFATVFLFPVSTLDTYFVASFHKFPILITLPIAIGFEVINAWLVYKASVTLIPKIVKKQKTKDKFFIVGEKLKKWGWWAIVIAGATPLPYSLTIYAAGAVHWGNNKKFMSAVLVGRGIKYGAFALALYFGWKIPIVD